MRVAILGRTHWLLDAARAIAAAGHEIVLVCSAASQPEYRAKEHDFEAFASENGAPYLFATRAQDGEIPDMIAQSAAEIAISINWPRILGTDVCDLPAHGVLNAHCGDLPRYRGNACPNWAIINGEQRIGLCVHRMVAGEVDAGPIFARDFLELGERTTIADVYRWLDEAIPRQFVRALANLGTPDFEPEDQTALQVRPLRCHPRRPEDGEIDWEMGAEEIDRLVRASGNPFAGAFSWLEGKERVIIWSAQPHELDHDLLAVPGQIIGSGPEDGVLVACGRGVIELLECELPNGRRLPAGNSYRLKRYSEQ